MKEETPPKIKKIIKNKKLKNYIIINEILNNKYNKELYEHLR